VGVDKHIIIFPKTWSNHYTQSASRVFVAFLEAMGRPRRDVGERSRDIAHQESQQYTHSSCNKLLKERAFISF
jgi:hypothetical protein